MVRALWLANEPPDRSLGGGSIRAAHLLTALAQRVETELVLVGSLRDPVTRRAVARVHEIPAPERPAPAASWRRRVGWLTHAVGGKDPLVIQENAPDRAALAAELGRHDAFDIVCVEHDRLAPLLPRRRENHWVLTLYHLVSEQQRQAQRIAAGPRQRWLHEREASKAQRFEQWAVGAYDTVIAVSALDATHLGGDVLVVENGVDTARFAAVGPPPSSPSILFTGRLDYRPNADGIVWFCDEVLPRIRAAVPDVTLDVVGRSPVSEVVSLGRLDGVEVHPDVPDTLPFYERARVCIVPLRLGSGTRLKALEAMASGRPVVGTSVGLEGLAIGDEEQVLVADDPDGLAQAVVRVLGDDRLSERLVANGRQYVEEHHDWSAIGRRYVDALLDRAGG